MSTIIRAINKTWKNWSHGLDSGYIIPDGCGFCREYRPRWWINDGDDGLCVKCPVFKSEGTPCFMSSWYNDLKSEVEDGNTSALLALGVYIQGFKPNQ
jgi:hypothetical protein